MSFHWQTDEESGESIGPDLGPSDANLRRRRAVWILVSAALLVVLAFIVWRTVERRAAATEEQMRNDVLAAHDLARRAVENGDHELYLSLIAPQFVEWRATQAQLLQDDLIFGGAARLYDLVPLRGAVPQVDVDLDPTLTQAAVFTQQSFAVTGTASLDESVTLRQLQTYRLGPDGWQTAPATGDFWSPNVRLIGDRVIVAYPQRDDAVARRLLTLLEYLLSQTCALPGMDCPRDLQVTVRLTPDRAALSRAMDPEALLRGDDDIELPSPTLTGQPLDERGQALVVRAFATRAMGPLISHLTGYDCCNRSLLVRAILERQLFHLGLRPWPLTADDHEALMEEGLTLGDALVLQRRGARAPDPDTWLQTLSLVEFLESASLPGALLTNMEGSLDAWLTQSVDAGRLEAQWSAFTYMRSRSAHQAQMLGLSPQGAIQLTCFESDAIAVLRYDVAAETWRHSLTYAPPEGWQVTAVFPLADGTGDIIKEMRFMAGGGRLARYVWRHDGGSGVLIETIADGGSARLFDLAAISSSPLAALVDSDYPTLRASLEQEWWRAPLAVCDGGDCETGQRMVRPHWSPDGEQLLLEVRPDSDAWRREEITLVRSDSRGEGATVVGRGYGPVWLGAGHYAYLRAPESGTHEELVVAAVHDDEPQLLATGQDFLDRLDERANGDHRLHLDGLQPGLGAPHLLLVQLTLQRRAGDNSPDTYLYGVSLNPDPRGPTQQMPGETLEIERLFHSTSTLSYRLAPNGRWLAATDFSGWRLLDLRQGSARNLSRGGPPAWSPDGDWLVQSRDNDLLLQHPDLGYKRPIVQDVVDCTFNQLQWQ